MSLTTTEEGLSQAAGKLSRLALPMAAALLLLGFWLRWQGADGSLWLDELWTLDFLSRLDSPLQIFIGPYLDNNHQLNSLYLYFLPEITAPRVLRGFAIACGTAGVLAAGLIGARRGAAGLLIYMAVFAVDFPYVSLGSEARGYAGLHLCWLLAIYLAEPREDGGAVRRRWALAAVALLGTLSHLLFVFGLVAIALWQFDRRFPATRRLRPTHDRVLSDLRPTVWAVGLPLLVTVACWQIYGKYLGAVPVWQGDNLSAVAERLARAFAYLLGLPATTPVGLGLGLSLSALGGLYLLHRRLAPERERQWRAFYVLCLLTGPLALLWMEQFRYLHLFSTAVLLLVADALTSLAAAGEVGSVLMALVFAAFAVGQSGQLESFYADKRGDSVGLLGYAASHGPGPAATIGGFHDFGDRLLLSGAARWLPRGKDLTYVSLAAHPDWLLVRRPGPAPRFCPTLELRPGARNRHLLTEKNAIPVEDSSCPWVIELPIADGKPDLYRLEKRAAYWGLSGFHGRLFLRVGP